VERAGVVSTYRDMLTAVARFRARRGRHDAAELLRLVVGTSDMHAIPPERYSDVIAAIAEATPPRAGS
jgi:hypothetical protein